MWGWNQKQGDVMIAFDDLILSISNQSKIARGLGIQSYISIKGKKGVKTGNYPMTARN